MPDTYMHELKLLEQLCLVRRFEERLLELYQSGLVYGTIHLGIGEEATGVGAVSALKEQDYVLSTHRGHVQALAKGIDPGRMMAEMLGKSTGTNAGFGGSMHVFDVEKNMLGQYSIVGANLPIACGAALKIRMQKEKDRVAAVFFGDGACNEGVVQESLNLAALWKLPILFICVNNGYGLSTPVCRASADPDLRQHAAACGMESMTVDGNDVLAMERCIAWAREKVLSEEKPMFILANTYRTSGHSKSDPNVYRSQTEIRGWMERNPVKRFEEYLKEQGVDSAKIEEAKMRAESRIQDAIDFAIASPVPACTQEQMLAAVYPEGGKKWR